jgi:hypothetical protein
MLDYWLNKVMYDLQHAELRTEFRRDPAAFLDRYPLSPEARNAALAGDVAYLLPRTNAYLMRFYVGYLGMPDDEFIRQLRACGTPEADEVIAAASPRRS